MERFETGTRLHGKAAIVTGAGNGIGAAVARLFAAQGARVAATDRDEAGLAGTTAAIREGGGEAVSFHHDIASEAAWADVVAGAVVEGASVGCGAIEVAAGATVPTVVAAIGSVVGGAVVGAGATSTIGSAGGGCCSGATGSGGGGTACLAGIG